MQHKQKVQYPTCQQKQHSHQLKQISVKNIQYSIPLGLQLIYESTATMKLHGLEFHENSLVLEITVK